MARNGKRRDVSSQRLMQAAAVQEHPAHGGSRRRRGRPTKLEAAGQWGVAQFSASRIHAALDDFDVEELVKSYVAIARDNTLEAKGRPIVATTAKLRALEKLRELHHDLASTESMIFEKFGGNDEPEYDDPDDGLQFLRNE